MGDTHIDHRGEPFTEVIAAGRQVLEQVLFPAVAVQRPRDCSAKPRDVRTPFDGVDIVNIRLHVLGVLRAVLHRDLEFDPLAGTDELDHLGVQHVTGPVQMLDKLNDPPLVLKVTTFTVAFIVKADVNAAVEERQLLQPLEQCIETVFRDTEDLAVRLERRLGACLFCDPTLLDWSRGDAPFVLLRPSEPLAADLDLRPLAQEVDDRHADPVQPAGSLIGPFLELAAKFQDRHHPLERADVAVKLLG